MDTTLLLVTLVEQQNDIAALRLFTPSFPRPVQTAPEFDGQQNIIQMALSLREQSRLPFWDCVLLVGSTAEFLNEDAVRLALRHNSQGTTARRLGRDDVTEQRITDLIRALAPGEILAVSSEVTLSTGESMHIPMLDFHCPNTETNIDLASGVVRSLGLTGYLLDSGASFHFYGDVLLSSAQMNSMLIKALLLSPIIDHRWVAHQLMEGACGLRISPGKQYNRCPRVVNRV